MDTLAVGPPIDYESRFPSEVATVYSKERSEVDA
jgi:hypothetical protein